jgi:hypothetical protein
MLELRMFLRFSCALLAGYAVLAGCGEASSGSFDGAAADAGMRSTGMISLDGESTLTLAPGASADFSARWTDRDGSPVVSGAVSFALEGMPRDASLRTLAATTDADGRAHGTIRAGSVASTFRVRIAAIDALPAYLDVAVGSDGFGTMRVEIDGGEPRPISTRVIHLHQGDVGCATALARIDGDRSRALGEGTTEATFEGLPAGLPFTVVARGLDATGQAVAEGCVATVRIPVENTVVARVTLAPRPLDIAGEYESALTITGATAAPSAIDALAAVIETTSRAAGSDAGRMLDALVTTLRDRGETDVADSLERAIESEGLETALEVELGTRELGPTLAIDDALRRIASGIRTLRIEGVLAVAPAAIGGGEAAASFTRRLIAVGGSGSTALFPSDTLLGDRRAPASVRWAAADDSLEVRALEVELPLGRLVLASITALAPGGTLLDALRAPSGCDVLETHAERRSEVSAVCDAACVESACDLAIEQVLAPLDTAVDALDEIHARVILAGTARAIDDDGDLGVDRFDPAALAGSWASIDGMSSDDVEATLDGHVSLR